MAHNTPRLVVSETDLLSSASGGDVQLIFPCLNIEWNQQHICHIIDLS